MNYDLINFNIMKQIINYKISIPFCFSIVVLFNACSSPKQMTNASPEEITRAINNDNWKFSANYATPNYGRSRNLTSEYIVTLANGKLTTGLPYYGKLNSAAGAMNGNPLDFVSTNFNLTKDTKNGGWTVTIKNPNTEVESMIFTFYDNGTAQLIVSMTNRTGISYSGRVMPANP